MSNHKASFKDGHDIWVDGYERALRRIKLWVEYAKEFINNTNYLKNKIPISFNKWASDENYRIYISNVLGLKYSDKTLKYIGDFGQGSSFTNTKFDGRATHMNVLCRWK